MRSFLNDFFVIELGFCFTAVVFLLLVPIRLALAWLLAVTAHELSHYIAIRAYQIPVYSVRIRASGVVMNTGPMSKKQEFVCALAGPVGGILMIFTARWLPCTAICAVVQSCYNLLPVFPLDGGRALRIILLNAFGGKSGEKLSTYISFGIIGLVAVLMMYLAWRFDLGVLPLCIIALLYLKTRNAKFPCKPPKQIVQ